MFSHLKEGYESITIIYFSNIIQIIIFSNVIIILYIRDFRFTILDNSPVLLFIL